MRLSDRSHDVYKPFRIRTHPPVAVQVVVQLLGDHMGWQMASYWAAQRLNDRIRSNLY